MPKKQRETTYRRSRVRIVFVVLMILLIAVALVGACTVFFRVEFVEVDDLGESERGTGGYGSSGL